MRNKESGVRHVRDWRIVEGDVRQYDFRPHEGQVDVLCGGPPCQPFSIGGRHLGHNDGRDMFPEAVRAVRQIKPKAFILENVRGLLRRGFANYYNYIIHQLCFPDVTLRGDEEWPHHLARLERLCTGGRHKGLRYNVVYQILNAADYGIPQRRARVIIVGLRADLGIEFSFPAPTHSEDALLHDKWVTGLYWERHRISRKKRPEAPARLRGRIARLACLWTDALGKPWRTVRDAISDLPRVAVGKSGPGIPNHYLNPGARSYAGHTGSSLDEPGKTLKAGDHGVPGGENTVLPDDGSIRYFSVRECARLQTFPDDWVFEGSWTEAMRQLGNAVPVSLGAVVTRKLVRLLRLADVTAKGLKRGTRNQALNRSLTQS